MATPQEGRFGYSIKVQRVVQVDASLGKGKKRRIGTAKLQKKRNPNPAEERRGEGGAAKTIKGNAKGGGERSEIQFCSLNQIAAYPITRRKKSTAAVIKLFSCVRHSQPMGQSARHCEYTDW
jgi:hypothetical protein